MFPSRTQTVDAYQDTLGVLISISALNGIMLLSSACSLHAHKPVMDIRTL